MLDKNYFSGRQKAILSSLEKQRGKIADLETRLLNTPPGQKHDRLVLRSEISGETNILRWLQGRFDEANEALRSINRQGVK